MNGVEHVLMDWSAWLTPERVSKLIRIVLLIVVGIPAVLGLAALVKKLSKKHLKSQSLLILDKVVRYGGLILLLITLLREFGFNLTAVLGAAGIAGVAVGFASQTSLSNIISGLFLIGEKPFEVSDVITVGGTTGIVESIDLLSVKLRTFDNKFVRIPNESLIKTEFTNVTRYPIRRYDLDVGVAYKEDLSRVMEILREVADKNPWSLDEPAPIVLFKGFGDSSLNLMLGMWFAKTDFLNLRNSITAEIKQRFDEEGIEIPFPHRTLYVGEVTKPFPVQMVESAANEDHE